MINLKILFFILLSIFVILETLILKKVETLNFQVKSLSLISDRLLLQNTEIILRVSKVQRGMDELTIALDKHSVLPMNFSIDVIYLIKVAFILIMSWYTIRSYIPAWALLKASSFFLTKKNDLVVWFLDFNENVYSIKYNLKRRMFDIFIKPVNSEETYQLEDFLRSHPLHPGVFGQIKSRLIEAVTQSTQTEAISDLTSEMQTEAVKFIPKIISELPTSAQVIPYTPEEIAYLVNSLSF